MFLFYRDEPGKKHWNITCIMVLASMCMTGERLMTKREASRVG
jgi:hypothetical protein